MALTNSWALLIATLALLACGGISERGLMDRLNQSGATAETPQQSIERLEQDLEKANLALADLEHELFRRGWDLDTKPSTLARIRAECMELASERAWIRSQLEEERIYQMHPDFRGQYDPNTFTSYFEGQVAYEVVCGEEHQYDTLAVIPTPTLIPSTSPPTPTSGPTPTPLPTPLPPDSCEWVGGEYEGIPFRFTHVRYTGDSGTNVYGTNSRTHGEIHEVFTSSDMAQDYCAVKFGGPFEVGGIEISVQHVEEDPICVRDKALRPLNSWSISCVMWMSLAINGKDEMRWVNEPPTIDVPEGGSDTRIPVASGTTTTTTTDKK